MPKRLPDEKIFVNLHLLMLYLNDHLEDMDLVTALPLLSAQRREQLMRYRQEADRRTCAAAYLLLCEGLRREYGLLAKPVFEYGSNGKPAIAGHPEIHFNISHCREAVVCILSDSPVGIDVENIREYDDDLARYTMNDAEMDAILHAKEPAVEFIKLWTRKEAVLKLTGEGISNDLKDVLSRRCLPRLSTHVSPDKRYVYSISEECNYCVALTSETFISEMTVS